MGWGTDSHAVLAVEVGHCYASIEQGTKIISDTSICRAFEQKELIILYVPESQFLLTLWLRGIFQLSAVCKLQKG